MWSALHTPLTQRLESPERLIDRSGEFFTNGKHQRRDGERAGWPRQVRPGQRLTVPAPTLQRRFHQKFQNPQHPIRKPLAKDKSLVLGETLHAIQHPFGYGIPFDQQNRRLAARAVRISAQAFFSKISRAVFGGEVQNSRASGREYPARCKGKREKGQRATLQHTSAEPAFPCILCLAAPSMLAQEPGRLETRRCRPCPSGSVLS